nr:hypothetical protein [uncultured Blautia sp.]
MSELLEKILSKDNMNAAYKRVCANKGAGGKIEGNSGKCRRNGNGDCRS